MSKTHPDGQVLKRLPRTLYNKFRIATTDYSKVSRGLHFPLGNSGLCTRQGVRRLRVGDRRDLVTPFMHVTNQMTRHFAHEFVTFIPSNFTKLRNYFTNKKTVSFSCWRAPISECIRTSLHGSDYILTQNSFATKSRRHIVSEDSTQPHTYNNTCIQLSDLSC